MAQRGERSGRGDGNDAGKEATSAFSSSAKTLHAPTPEEVAVVVNHARMIRKQPDFSSSNNEGAAEFTSTGRVRQFSLAELRRLSQSSYGTGELEALVQKHSLGDSKSKASGAATNDVPIVATVDPTAIENVLDVAIVGAVSTVTAAAVELDTSATFPATTNTASAAVNSTSETIPLQPTSPVPESVLSQRPGKRPAETSPAAPEPVRPRTEGLPTQRSAPLANLHGNQIPSNNSATGPMPTEESFLPNHHDGIGFQRSCVSLTDTQSLSTQPIRAKMDGLLATLTQLEAWAIGVSDDIDMQIAEKEKMQSALISATTARSAAERSEKDALEELASAKILHAKQVEAVAASTEDKIQEMERKRLGLESMITRLKDSLEAANYALAEREAAFKYSEEKLQVVSAELEKEPERQKASIAEALEAARAELGRDLVHYGVIFRRSALFMIKKKYPDISFEGIHFEDLEEPEDEVSPHENPVTLPSAAVEPVTVEDLFADGNVLALPAQKKASAEDLAPASATEDKLSAEDPAPAPTVEDPSISVEEATFPAPA